MAIKNEASQKRRNLGDSRLKKARQSLIMDQAQLQEEDIDVKIQKLCEIDKDIYDMLFEDLEKLDKWDFDIFLFYNKRREKAFVILGIFTLDKLKIYQNCNVRVEKWFKFLTRINEGYQYGNHYHNDKHIMDTVQAMYYFMETLKLKMWFEPKEILTAFVATFIHDFEHPGVNNQFLIRTKHPKAIRYNDNSPLENHHVAAAFNIIFNPKWNFLSEFSKDDLRDMRMTMINMILKSDLSRHFEEYTSLKTKISNTTFPSQSFEDKQTLLVIALKACDLSKPCRNVSIYLKWIDAVMEEFFAQGDMEKMLGIPISPFMERNSISLSREKVQLAYIDVVVRPLIVAWCYVVDNNEDATRELQSQGLEATASNLMKKVGEANK